MLHNFGYLSIQDFAPLKQEEVSRGKDFGLTVKPAKGINPLQVG